MTLHFNYHPRWCSGDNQSVGSSVPVVSWWIVAFFEEYPGNTDLKINYHINGRKHYCTHNTNMRSTQAIRHLLFHYVPMPSNAGIQMRHRTKSLHDIWESNPRPFEPCHHRAYLVRFNGTDKKYVNQFFYRSPVRLDSYQSLTFSPGETGWFGGKILQPNFP